MVALVRRRLGGVVAVVGGDDAADQAVPHDVVVGELAEGDVLDPVEDLLRAAQRGLPAPLLRRPLAAVAAAWSSPDLLFWRESQAQRAWWLARTLNRQAGGVLALAGGPALDWRRDLAGYWVNHQRIAPRGGGHWLSDAVSPVEETAFAILLLREL